MTRHVQLETVDSAGTLLLPSRLAGADTGMPSRRHDAMKSTGRGICSLCTDCSGWRDLHAIGQGLRGDYSGI